ncbi:hypothetical protein J6Z48_00810 [bacterium]|nr:hypothetical protein [bacterium]
MRKSAISLFYIVGIVVISLLLKKYYNTVKDNPKSTDNINTEQELFNDDLSPIFIEETENNKESSVDSNQVYVPYFWKYGVNTDKEDYLLGYIPNISTFKAFYKTYNNINYGVLPHNDYSLENIEEFITKKNIIYSNGIKNSTYYYAWNTSDCKSYKSSNFNETLFVCNNWVNWLGLSLDKKNYVLTKCNIEGTNGYCVFENYIDVYYEINKSSETRCFEDNDNYYCKLEKYKDLILYN